MRNSRAKKLKKQLLLTHFDVDKEREYTHKEFKDMYSDRKFTAIYRRRKKNEQFNKRLQQPKIVFSRSDLKYFELARIRFEQLKKTQKKTSKL